VPIAAPSGNGSTIKVTTTRRRNGLNVVRSVRTVGAPATRPGVATAAPSGKGPLDSQEPDYQDQS
jgi:hypothetical protein